MTNLMFGALLCGHRTGATKSSYLRQEERPSLWNTLKNDKSDNDNKITLQHKFLKEYSIVTTWLLHVFLSQEQLLVLYYV